MSVYTSASSCFLASCLSVTLSPCSAATTAPNASPGPEAATLLPMEAAAALRKTLPALYLTLG